METASGSGLSSGRDCILGTGEYIGVIYKDNGKENGKCHNGLYRE